MDNPGPGRPHTHCGQYPNVIPDLAEAWYIYRIPARTDLEAIHERILKCAKGAAIATETEWEAKIINGTHGPEASRSVRAIDVPVPQSTSDLTWKSQQQSF